MSREPFYADGLRFTCTRCSTCCRFDPGYVFLSQRELQELASALGISYSEFEERFCRWIPEGEAYERLSLKEKSNYDCIFWDNGCTVYQARPVQCRTFPFWASILASEENWNAAMRDCPGMGKGILHDRAEIEELLSLRRIDPIIRRKKG